MLLEIGIILLLIVANGVFAGSEIAIVSARQGRLQQLADEGNRGAAAALHLQEDPNRFLSTVQIGITLIGTLAGAFGGASLATRLAVLLAPLPGVGEYADNLALVFVVLGITYLSLVIGELVPKRLALKRAEPLAATLSLPMTALASISRPAVAFLGWSTETVLRLFGDSSDSESRVTEEDIRYLVREGAEEGTVEPEEKRVIEGVFNLSERTVRQIMTPRKDMYALDGDAPLGKVLAELIDTGYSRFPVYQRTTDNLVGVVHVRDVLDLYHTEGEQALVRSAMLPLTVVPEQMPAARLLPIFRKNQRHLAVVVSELGTIEGVVTLEDVLEEIVGDILDEHDVEEAQAIVTREDGSLLIDGTLPIDVLKDRLDIDELPNEEENYYDTLAGFLLNLLGRIPSVGDSIDWDGWRFEIVDMDGFRIDKVLVQSQRSQ